MTSDFSPIEAPKQTLAAQVQERIRDAIIRRVLKPGTRIDQNKLADDLHVSLVPVREALKSLQAEGLVTIIPRRGAFVTEVSQEHLDDLYFARQIIEGEAVYHAVPHLQPAHFAEQHRLMREMQQATDAHDIALFMDLNRQFHMLIYEALGNQHLMQTILSLWERSELYRYRYMFVLHNAAKVHAEHAALVEACGAGDAPRAKELAILHIRNTQIGIHKESDDPSQESR
jgi:DNA-binding GntR family transcriptional regulator